MKMEWAIIAILVLGLTGCGSTQSNVVEMIDLNHETSPQTDYGGSETFIETGNRSLVFLQSERDTFFSDLDGFYVDLIREIYRREGIDVEFQIVSETEIENMLLMNKAFGSPGWSQIAGKYENVVFTNNFYATPFYLYYKEKGQAVLDEYKDIRDLEGLVLGMDTTSEEFSAIEYSQLQIKHYNANEGMTALLNDEIDIFIGSAIALKNIDENIKHIQKPFAYNYQSIRVGKDYPGHGLLIESFDNGLKKLWDDGTYSELLEKYNLPDPDPNIFEIQYANTPIEIGFTEFPPYEHTDIYGNPQGICIDSIRTILAQKRIWSR